MRIGKHKTVISSVLYWRDTLSRIRTGSDEVNVLAYEGGNGRQEEKIE